MSRHLYRIFLRRSFPAVLSPLALCLCLAYPSPAAPATTPSIRIPGHLSAPRLASTPVGSVEPDDMLDLAIVLRLRDQAGLEDFLRRLYTPGDPLFGRYLSTSEFTERFGPTPLEYQEAINFARAQGFRIVATHPNRALLNVAAPARVVETAFQVRLLRYRAPDGSTFRAPDVDPAVPVSLSRSILGVIGLDDARVETADGFSGPLGPAMADTPEAVGTGQGGYLCPADIEKAYNLDAVSEEGAGQVLAIVGFDGYKHSDIATYNSTYFPGRPAVPLEDVLIDGCTGTPASVSQGEVTSNIEMQVAMAPAASKILVYLAPYNHATGSVDLYTTIANDNRAKLVSTSWSFREDPAYMISFHAENNAFLQMAAQGQSMFAASGNRGAYYNTATPTILAVGDRASQPFVTGVGGTRLTTTAPGGAWHNETSWNDPTTTPKRGGGGGISTLWSLPWYQTGVITPASLGSAFMRNVPDVSLNATTDVGYSTYINGSWGWTAGTSLATPLWSGFMARVNQRRSASGRDPMGFSNPALYRILQSARYHTDFHDIADGSTNLYYPAVGGYDLSTGIGTPKGADLLQDLAMEAPAVPGITFSRPPGNGRTGQPLSVQPEVTVFSDTGQPAHLYGGPVTVSIKPGTGAIGAVLGGATTVNAVAGYANFTNLSIDREGTGYVLTATAAGMSANSTAFSIASPRPVFTTQPMGGDPGQPFSRQPVITFQVFSEAATDITAPVTVSIKAGTGAKGAILSGNKTVVAGDGVATFTDLSIDRPGTGYVLTASGNGFTVDSLPFSVLPARVFVSKEGSNTNDGTSWAAAKATVGAGLASVAPRGEVWVAQGVYYERITLRTGISLYGGFFGDETSLVRRRLGRTPTVLDGESNETVVTIDSGARRDTVLDGFTIRNGGRTLSLSAITRGGGINCTDASPTIRYNTIRDNRATLGGGLYIYGGSPLVVCNVIVDNAAVASDQSIGVGGGVGIGGDARAILLDNVIAGNAATGMTNTGAYSRAGAIACVGAAATIRNNTVTGNVGVYKTEIHGTVNTSGGIVLSGSEVTLSNNIVAFNRGANLDVTGPRPTLNSNDFYNAGGIAYMGNVVGIADPTGTDRNINLNPAFALYAGGDYRLCSGSPCVDAGDIDGVTVGETDVTGGARLLGPDVDMGAYESGVQTVFTLGDASRALAVAGGWRAGAIDDLLRLNIVPGTLSAQSIDLSDAAALSRMALSGNPTPE